MSGSRTRVAVVAGVSAALLGGTAAFGVSAWADRRESTDPAASAAAPGTWAGEGRIVFRTTAPGDDYGHVASVDIDAPAADRRVSSEVCDRVDATPGILSCLRIVRGVVPAYSATVSRPDGSVVGAWPLPGIPSRTRISPAGDLVATTAFVSGHSYATVGFSTATVIARQDGSSLGNLEDWRLTRDGTAIAPSDRNFWGVTFADDQTFYATVGMSVSGTTWLVRGDIPSRTLEMIVENVECPSLSPDGTRIAFKRVTGSDPGGPHWTPAVYDIATGRIDLLPEARGIDDQIEWLDGDTILYGMPRDDTRGDGDVWALDVDGTGEPRVLIEHAWSPAVVPDGSGG